MKCFSVLIVLCCLMSFSRMPLRENKNSDTLEEQSFFSGHYYQTHDYEGGQSVDVGRQSVGNIVSFDLNSGSHLTFGPSLSDSDIKNNDLYSPAFEGYQFKKYDDDKYDSLIVGSEGGESMNGAAWVLRKAHQTLPVR